MLARRVLSTACCSATPRELTLRAVRRCASDTSDGVPLEDAAAAVVAVRDQEVREHVRRVVDPRIREHRAD
jgi:hypothetical protein